MEYGGATMGMVLCSVWVGCWILFGLALMFARAENIERPILVGALTLLTSSIAAILLANEARLGLRTTAAATISIAVVAVFGYGFGRVLDLLLGPKLHSPEETEPTLGADLAD